MTPLQKRSLQRVDSNSRHLLAIINEILDITRIESGRMPLNASSFALPDLLDEVRSELEPIIARSQVPVQVALGPKLPGLHTDRQKLKQIVLNLIGNALKFTHEGWIRVQARYDARKRKVVIAVRDTGIGIPPEYHERVFEDFQQVDPSTTRPYMGTGLGLSISRRLAHVLGGDIELESTVGKGSTFTLRIPARLRRPRPRGTEQRP
jgi:signal transduction histidine kinase